MSSTSTLPPRLGEPLAEALAGRFGGRFTRSLPIREQHAQSLHAVDLAAPEGVLYVNDTDEVAEAVRLCGSHRCPIVAFGAGTSIGGHVSAVQGGVAMNLTSMNRVLEINASDFDCRVQAGVTREQLNAELRHRGLSSRSTLARTRRWAAWPPRAPAGPPRCAMAPCART